MVLKMKIIKSLISLISISLLVVHLFFYKITFDPVAITLFVFAVLPWIISIIKSIELPGGITIELKDIMQITNKLVSHEHIGKGGLRIKKDTSAQISFVSGNSFQVLKDISISNPSLSLAGVRIEIEKRVRMIGSKFGLLNITPLGKLIKELESQEIFSKNYANGLLELISICNKVIHGNRISDDAVKMVLDNTPVVIEYLDELVGNKDDK